MISSFSISNLPPPLRGDILGPAAVQHPHVLRHTWITHRLQEGVPPADVSEAAGHSNTGTTLSNYAHAIPSENRERLRVDLDALLK